MQLANFHKTISCNIDLSGYIGSLGTIKVRRPILKQECHVIQQILEEGHPEALQRLVYDQENLS